ncbi:MAG TPA: glycosyltransferase [Cyclobacteriaceae bacterium]|nr:glycosyltransferase [Cyclobacteriaceae bacterium]
MDRKILVVIGSFKIGGAERMALNIGSALLGKGYDVHFALLRPIFELPHTIPNERIHILAPQVKNKFLNYAGILINMLLLRLKLKPDVVIGFTYFSSFVACFSFAKFIIARFDVNPYQMIRKQKHFLATVIAYFPKVRYIVVPSNGLSNDIVKRRKVLRKKVKVISNSIDIDNIIKQSTDLIINENDIIYTAKPYISALGRFTPQKNFELLINAYAKSKIKERLNLLIIGRGNRASYYTSLITRLRLTEKVFLIGQRENPFPLIARSSFMVNTSLYESFCNVIVEALCLGKPVIASDCPYGPAELIAEGVNGYLFLNNSESELVAVFDRIAENPELVNKLSVNANKSIERFKLNAIVVKWEEIILNNEIIN